MRIELLLAALVALAELPGPAYADLSHAPRFDAVDTRLILRNDLLRAIVGTDPQLVRRILDIIERSRGVAHSKKVAPVDHETGASTNPDLIATPRGAESSSEWHDLIARAKAEKQGRREATTPTNGRSSEGTLEMIQMMQRAKAQKEQATAK